MKNRNVDMLSGSITKGLLSMTIPIMIMNVMQTLFSILDMTALRFFSDDKAVGAVGACGTLITLCTSLLIGISAGANVVVAKRIGLGDNDRTDKAVITSVLLSVAGGFTLLIIGVLFSEAFLKMTNCPGILLRQATRYFKIYFYGIPLQMLYNFSAAILRANGDAKRPMYYLISGGITKIIFTVFFLTVFKMNVEGVAFATIISNAVMGFLSFRALLKSKYIVCRNYKEVKFYGSELKEILFIGIPTGLQSSLYSLANVVITAAVNSFGADATTGIAIANQFDGILYQISCATSFAAIPYVAQNIGAKNIKRVKQTLLSSILLTTAFGGTFGMLSALFSEQLSSIMSSSPAVIEFSRQKMIIISSTYFICGINEVIGGVLKGMGKPILPAVSALVYMCLFRFVWVYAIFPFFRNMTFLYLVWPISWLLSIATLIIAYIPAISKLHKLYSSQTKTAGA